MTYRIRLLNAHFDNAYFNISFAAFYDKNSPNQVELDPFTNRNIDLASQMVQIPFTVIGADSSLFNRPFPGVVQLDMGSGERVEVLIKFDSNNKVPSFINYIYIVCYDFNFKQYAIKAKYQLSSQTGRNKYADPQNTPYINVPFKDLSLYKKNQVIGNRMQVLLNWPREQRFLINGHYMFGMGSTDRPQIGTT